LQPLKEKNVFIADELDDEREPSKPFIRTLAARKAFDDFRPNFVERRSDGNEGEEEETPMNLEVAKPKDAIAEDVAQAEPMDFSVKKVEERKSPNSNAGFTSTRELRFARNLKLILMAILREHPEKGGVIVDYMKWAGKIARERGRAVQRGPTYGVNDGGSGNNVNNNGNNGSGGSGGGGGRGSPNDSDSSRDGSTFSGGGGVGNGPGGGGAGGGRGGGEQNNNNGGNDTIDLDCLDFSSLASSSSPPLTQGSTARWFADHPEINPAKVFEGLTALKQEFAPPPPAPPHAAPPPATELKPPDLVSLDTATANLLQLSSVPDPSTTFLDIGTDSSMYEDDPFKIENLLPANFGGNNSHNHSPEHPQQQHQHQQHHSHPSPPPAVLPLEHANFGARLQQQHLHLQSAIRQELQAKQHQHNHQAFPQHKPPPSAAAAAAAAAIGMSLYPETTISAILPGQQHQQPQHPQQPHIKTEPLTLLPYYKKEDQGPSGHHLDNHATHHHSSSPPSSMGSVGSPGSPPGFGTYPSAPRPSGGGKMSGPSSSGHHRRRACSGSGGPSHSSASASAMTPDEEELSNVPSLQMRIKILQNRVMN